MLEGMGKVVGRGEHVITLEDESKSFAGETVRFS